MALHQSIINPNDIFYSNSGNNIAVSNVCVKVNGEPVDEDTERYLNYIHVNTYSGEQLTDPSLAIESTLIHCHIDSDCDANIHIDASIDGTACELADFSASVLEGVKFEYKKLDKLNGRYASYELLRANPKLTGNIKVVVDSSSNMYFDTFKSAAALESMKYRKIPINPNEYYGRGLMQLYHNLSSADLYKVEDKCSAIFEMAENYSDQYYDMYNSGVRTNSDKLYSENFKILAPLCINKIMPDFFLVFRVDPYSYSEKDDADKLRYFLSNGEIVKVFDLREGTSVGTYMRDVYEHSTEVVSDGYMSYDPIGYNLVNGISVDRGVVTSAYESGTQLLVNATSQVGLNSWLTKGFERNKLVSKNIVNFEFMFNDTDSKLFSANTYFGLYIKTNPEGSFICTGKNEDESYYAFAGDTQPVAFSAGEWPTVIYGVESESTFKRLFGNIYDASDKALDEFIQPRINIAKPVVGQLVDASSYMTFTLKDPMKIGEHYKFVDMDSSCLYEIIVARGDENCVVESVTRNNFVMGDASINMQRVSISRTSSEDSSISDDINDIVDAFKLFDDSPFTINHASSDSISFTSNKTNVYFEKICSMSGYTDEQIEILSTYEDESFTVFGNIHPKRMYAEIRKLSEQTVDSSVLPFFPLNFSALGDRVCYVVKFNDLTDCIEVDNAVSTETFENTLLYQNTNNEFVFLENVGVKCLVDTDDSYEEESCEAKAIMSSDLDNLVVRAKDAKIRSDRFLLYEPYTIKPSICSIIGIKDYNYDVLDNRTDNILSPYRKNSSAISSDGGEYMSSDNCYGISILKACEDNFKDVLDTIPSISRVDSSGIEIPLSTFLTNVNDSNTTKKAYLSQTPIMAPCVCKWRLVGTDARGSGERVMYKHQNNVNVSTNTGYLDGSITSFFIVPEMNNDTLSSFGISDDGSTYNSIGNWDKLIKKCPGFASTSETTIATYDKFICNDINVCVPSIDASTSAVTLKDYIMKGNGSIDDFLYTEDNSSDKYSVAYAQGKDSLVFVSGGIVIKLTTNNTNILNIAKYSGYQAILVSTDKPNDTYPTPYELIIDETEEKIMLVWHTCDCKLTDGLNASAISSLSYDTDSSVITIPHTYKLYEEKTCGIDGSVILATPIDDTQWIAYDASPYAETSAAIRSSIFKTLALESMSKTQVSYTSDANLMCVTNDVSISRPLKNTVDLYDDSVKFLSGTDYSKGNKIFIDGVDSSLTLNTLKDTESSYYQNVEMYGVLVDGKSYDSSASLSSPDDIFNGDVAIYVKDSYETKDYTNINDLLAVERVNPHPYIGYTPIDNMYVTHGYTTPSYIEPVSVNMIDFVYEDPSTAELNNIFSMNFNGCNVMINDVKSINQMWIKKVPDPTTINISNRTYTNNIIDIDIIHDMSIMTDIWHNNVYRTYDIINDTFTKVNGMYTGMEQNMFLASRGINLNGKDGRTVTLSVWKNTEASNGMIKLDITETLTNTIMFSEGFMETWWNTTSGAITPYKTKYIENSILNLIDINNSTEFTIYKISTGTSITFIDYSDDHEANKMANIKNEIRKESDRYYMYVYPSDGGTYSAKMIINL